MAKTQRVAILGTGIMGSAMARNIADAGLDVRAWNRSREKAKPLADDGVTVADSAADAVGEADAVLTMLADADAVRSVMQDGGALEAMAGDAVWVQSSTIGVAGLEEMAKLAGDRGVAFLDSPVLGTKQPAEQGELIILAAGDSELRERCEPLFDAIGQKTVIFDEVGDGTRMKLVLNSWLLALTAGLAEAIALAKALGIDPARFLEVIEGGPIGVPYAKLKGSMMIEGSYDEPAFPLRLAHKDARLVLEGADGEGVELPIVQAIERRFGAAADAGHGEDDMAAVHRAYD